MIEESVVFFSWSMASIAVERIGRTAVLGIL